MSAYAASISEKKINHKSRKPRHNNHQISKLKEQTTPQEEHSITGFRIRRKIVRSVIFCFEAYLGLIVACFVVVYVYGRRLFRSRSLSNAPRYKNPYSLSQRSITRQSGSYKDLSSVNGGCPVPEEEGKLRPPRCLEDPILGAHKFIKIQGVKLHYVEAGAGKGRPTLLLLHGAFDFWFTWRKLIPALARRFRVLSLDLRGCGDSEKPLLRSSYTLELLREDIASFIRTVGDPVHDGTGGVALVCAGWGGQVGWAVAQAYPGLLRKMVLIHSPHPYVLRSCRGGEGVAGLRSCFKLWPVLFTRLPGLPEWAASEDNLALVSRLLEPLLAGKNITEEEVEAYFYTFSRPEDFTGALHHVRNWELFGRAGGNANPPVLSTPTLLLMGDADPHIPLDAGYKSAEYVERIKTRVLSGGSSWAPVTHHTNILEEMATFFNEPRILHARSCSSDEDWDDDNRRHGDEEGGGVYPRGRGGLVGRVVGAGLSVVSRWNGGGRGQN